MGEKKRRPKNQGDIMGIILPFEWDSKAGPHPEVQRLELPKDQEARDEMIARATFRRFDQLRELGESIQSPYPSDQIRRPRLGDRSREDDIDFEFTDGSGEYLELTEFTPPELGKLRGKYDLAPTEYLVDERAGQIEAQLRGGKCSPSRYGPDVRQRLHVLMYVTHWTQSWNSSVLNRLRAAFAGDPPGVKSIVLFHPATGTAGDLDVIQPHAAPDTTGEAATSQEPVRQGCIRVGPDRRPFFDFGNGFKLTIDSVRWEPNPDPNGPPFCIIINAGDTELRGYFRHPGKSFQMTTATIESEPNDPADV